MIFPPLQLPETSLRGQRLHVGAVGGKIGGAANEPPGTVLSVAAVAVKDSAAGGTMVLRELWTEVGSHPRPFPMEEFSVGDRFS